MRQKENDNTVFYGSVGLTLILIVFGLVHNELFGSTMTAIFDWICQYFNWYLVSVLTFYILFMIYIACSKYGKIKLGPDDSEPEFSTFSWLAMLFSAGMGSGLVFFGAAEPAYHFIAPPPGIATFSPQAADLSMQLSFLHWGVHPWGIYGITAMVIGYFSMRKNRPVLLGNFVEPLFKNERVALHCSHFVDSWMVFVTVAGIASSLGIASSQMGAGIARFFNIPNSIWFAEISLGLMSVVYIITAVAGLKKGIKVIADINVYLSILICGFLFLFGPTLGILQTFVTSLGAYVANLPDWTLRVSPWDPDFDVWQRGWTVLYWLWWLSWGPFCGVFFARVSYGRSMRELVMGSLIIPPLGSFAWMTIFGSTAISAVMKNPTCALADSSVNNMSMALWDLMAMFPLSSITTIVCFILVATFLVTSANSGTFVVGMLSSNGDINPTTKRRLFIWGMMAVISAITLFAGDFRGIQKLAGVISFPYSIMTIFMAWALVKAMSEEMRGKKSGGDSQ
ncbi:MAG: BCCT family transporter [Synergistaceae bacterium]|nr:BCCT family transporter [Synergistaceae bacterium]